VFERTTTEYTETADYTEIIFGFKDNLSAPACRQAGGNDVAAKVGFLSPLAVGRIHGEILRVKG
jgi:hypothetical protein